MKKLLKDYESKMSRLHQIRAEIKQQGFRLEYAGQNGAMLFKDGEFVYVEALRPLLDEYEAIRLQTDAHYDELERKHVLNGIHFIVADTVSGDLLNIFEDYQDALDFFNEEGADGEYDVMLLAVFTEDGEVRYQKPLLSKTVKKANRPKKLIIDARSMKRVGEFEESNADATLKRFQTMYPDCDVLFDVRGDIVITTRD